MSSKTLMPFLYPCFFKPTSNPIRLAATRSANPKRVLCRRTFLSSSSRNITNLADVNAARRAEAYQNDSLALEFNPYEERRRRLNPAPDEYARNIFVDECKITIHAGSGGNGCVSFLRDAHISDGPPNGGDGGSGGNIWIQPVSGHTSLHKLARRGIIKAGRGTSGQGKSQGGRKGEDVCIQVPVGTVVRELWRSDPVADEETRRRELKGLSSDDAEAVETATKSSQSRPWILYPGASGQEAKDVESTLPPPPRPRRSHLAALQPAMPINLDLDKASEKPVLLVAGGMGGLGNPHFATKEITKPKFATKGEPGVRISLQLELKLLADVGLVGLPNAGKSTLLRAISNSRTRVGNWAFTTLEPSIGTVVLDTNEGRPLVRSGVQGEGPRTHFTVADIPGLVEDAHLDRGLGLGFLRHIERARILAFVVDLSAGDAVLALQNLWKEVGEYENLRNIEISKQSESRTVEWTTFGSSSNIISQSLVDDDGRGMILFPPPSNNLEPLKLPPISAKPWFVVATKADKEGTQDEFMKLRAYVSAVEQGETAHPSGQENGWRSRIAAIPVSAINGEGTEKIAYWAAGLLDSMSGAGSSSSLAEPRTPAQS